jgi:hypothetical protein
MTSIDTTLSHTKIAMVFKCATIESTVSARLNKLTIYDFRRDYDARFQRLSLTQLLISLE